MSGAISALYGDKTMQAICTKYIGPTDWRGARIKAYCEGGLSTVIVAYPHELSGQAVHYEAVKAFCARFPAWGQASDYIAGGIKGGFAWVKQT